MSIHNPRSVLSINDVSRSDIEKILHEAKRVSERTGKIDRLLNDFVIGVLFFQTSTRTRLSFESAAVRLGAQCIGFADPSGARAGSPWKETLEDTARMLNAYADAVVIRHPVKGAAAAYDAVSTIPVLNAGDGSGMDSEHPTQAILDLFTLRLEVGKIDGLRILLVGDMHQRAPHSLMRALAKFCDVTVYVFECVEYQLPSIEDRRLSAQGLNIQHVTCYDDCIDDIDAIYLAGMENPEHPSPENHILTREILERAGPSVRVFHPLPRGNELPAEIDHMPQAAYFRQAANGVPVRMAILERTLLWT